MSRLKHKWTETDIDNWESDDWRWTIRLEGGRYAVRDCADEEWLEEDFKTFDDAEREIARLEKLEIATMLAFVPLRARLQEGH